MKCPIRNWPSMGLLALAAVPAAVSAQVTAASDKTGIDEIEVRATRTPKPLNKVPTAISVVTKEAIQRGRQQLGLDESLAAVPGLFIQGRYNFAQDLRIAIRGFGARSNFGIRGVKILVDGIPESLPDGQAQSDGLDLSSAEQIEVIRGPASSLYGNASGGVIHIETERGPTEPFVESRLSAGNFNFSKIQLKAGGDTQRLNYLINVSDLQYDGYRRHSETEDTLLNARFVYTIDDSSEFGVVVNVTDQPVANDPGGLTLRDARADPGQARQRNVDFAAGEALDQQRLGLSYRKAIGNRGELQLRNYYVWREFANKLPFTAGGTVQFDRSFIGGGASYIHTGDFRDRTNTLIVGFDLDRQDDKRQRFDNNMGERGALAFDQTELVTSLGAFIQNEIEFSDKVTLTVGLRYDEVEFDVDDNFVSDGDDSGQRTLSETSPMFGLVYAITESTSLYATYSTSFETPTTTEFANPSGSGGFNPDIDPQTAENLEMGIRGLIGHRNRYEVSVFTMDVDDELIPFELASQPGRDFFSNAGQSSRHGAEFAFSSEPIDNLSLSLAYTYSNFEFDRFLNDAGDDFSGNAIPGIPDHLLRAELAYRHPSGFYGAVDILDVGSVFVNNANTVAAEPYTVANLRLGFTELRFGRWAVSPFVGINNLSDENYAANVRINAFGGRFLEPAPDRHYYGGVSVRYTFSPNR